MSKKDFLATYGNVYDGLFLNKRPEKRLTAIFYPFWFVVRRLIFAFCCVWFEGSLQLQLTISLAFTMVSLGYLWQY